MHLLSSRGKIQVGLCPLTIYMYLALYHASAIKIRAWIGLQSQCHFELNALQVITYKDGYRRDLEL